MIGEDHIEYMDYLQKKLPKANYSDQDELEDERARSTEKPSNEVKLRNLSQHLPKQRAPKEHAVNLETKKQSFSKNAQKVYSVERLYQD